MLENISAQIKDDHLMHEKGFSIITRKHKGGMVLYLLE